MSKFAGLEVAVGIGIEFTQGTAKTATHSFQWQDFSMQALAEKSLFNSARGGRNLTSNSMIMRQYAQGNLAVIPNVKNAPYLFLLALGSISSPLVGTETTVYAHTITPQNAGASMKTATLLATDAGIQTNQYTNVVVDSLTLECSNDYAKLTANMIGQYPTAGSFTPSYTNETEFAYPQMTVKFGTSLTNAAAASPTLVKDIKLEIKNNYKIDESFLSGSNGIVAGGLIAGPLKVTGEYTLHFADTTELNKYKANTLNAMIIEFTGAAIGNNSTEDIKIKLAKLVLTKEPVVYKIDAVTVLKQQFEVSYDATDKDITVIVQNLVTPVTYAPAS